MELLTISEYAKKKGCSVQAVYRKIHRGTIEFKKIGSVYLIYLNKDK